MQHQQRTVAGTQNQSWSAHITKESSPLNCLATSLSQDRTHIHTVKLLPLESEIQSEKTTILSCTTH